MLPEEIRLRALYLYLACAQGVETFKDELATVLPDGPEAAKPTMDRTLRRELGLLFRYWTTREIWERLETDESSAKQLNLMLLRLFTEGLRLPRDGSGLRYAELSAPAEQVHEMISRIATALGTTHAPLLDAVRSGAPPWREVVVQYVVDALELPMSQIRASVKGWAERRTTRSEGT